MDLFAVIADPTRRQMIDMMRGGELPAGTFVAAFPKVSQPAISQHLKVLRDSGVAFMRADKQRRFYALNAAALGPVRDWIAPNISEPAARAVADTAPVEKTRKPRPKPMPEPEFTLDLFG